jgi:hypothetical protein
VSERASPPAIDSCPSSAMSTPLLQSARVALKGFAESEPTVTSPPLYVIGAAAGRGLGTRLLGQACAITRHQPRGITDSRERCLHAFPRRTCDAEPDARRGRRDLTRSACREQWKRRARGANGRVSPARGRSALPSVRAADAKRRTQDGAARRSTARARQNPPRGHRTVVALRGIDKRAVGRELPPHGHIDSGH